MATRVELCTCMLCQTTEQKQYTVNFEELSGSVAGHHVLIKEGKTSTWQGL